MRIKKILLVEDNPDDLELTLRAFEILDPYQGRPEQDKVFGGLSGDSGCPTNQVARLIQGAKLDANHRQPAKGPEMSGLLGEHPSIGAFGCLQGKPTGNRDR